MYQSKRPLVVAAGLFGLVPALTAAPAPPTNVSARPAGPTAIVVEWSPAGGESGFRVERESGGSWLEVGTSPAGSTGQRVEGLDVGSGSDFRVIAFDGDGDALPSAVVQGETTVRMNVLFLLADDLGLKDIVALRDPMIDGATIYETPALDTLVAESVRFRSAYASGPKCVVSRRSLLTGMYDIRPEAVPSGGGIGAEMVTLGEAMQAGGYRTGYIGKWHLGGAPDHPDRMPANQGFDVSIAAGEFGAPNDSYFPVEVPGSDPVAYSYNLPDLGDTADPAEYLTDRLTAEAAGFIGDHVAAHPDDPFFLTLAHYAVHTPLEAKPDDIAYFTARKAALAAELGNHPSAGQPFTEDYTSRQRNIQDNVIYASMLRSLDDSLASLRTYLAGTADPRNPGKMLDETTIVVVSSDHGGKSTRWLGVQPKDEELPTANYPMRLGKTWCYEGGLKIPIIVHFPGVSGAGTASDALVHNADFYTTFLDLTASPRVPSQHLDSISFAPLVADPAGDGDRMESFHWFTNSATGTGNPALAVLRRGDFKLVYHINRRITELYHLGEDPDESRDIAGVRPDVAAEMFRDLIATRNAVGGVPAKPSSNSWQTELEVLAPVLTIPPLPDGTPSDAAATAVAGTVVDLSWTDNSTNEERFVIERKEPGDAFREIATVGADVTTFRDIRLQPDTTYQYRIQAETLAGWAGSGDSSNNVTTQAASVPAPLSPADDSVTTLVDSPRTFDPLANDEGDGLTIVSVGAPIFGSVQHDGNLLTFTPGSGTTGSDSFVYTVADSGGNEATATVSVDVLLSHDAAPTTAPGAYWAFQEEQDGLTLDDSTFTTNVSYFTLPSVPTLARTGDRTGTFVGVGDYSFTHFGGATWQRGRTATWNANAGASTNNTLSITIDTTGGQDWAVRLSYRLKGLVTEGVPIEAFAAFEYRVGDTGDFTPVPGANLSLVPDQSNREWSANLRDVEALNDGGAVTLRWVIPDFDATASSQLRIDDLQITGIPLQPPPPRDRLLPEGDFNVLFLPIDDLKPLIDAYGEDAPLRPITPNLDRLAARGLVFTNAHCQQAICNASRASLLTGMRPDYTRCWKLDTHFRDIHPEVTTLPQHFGARGYRSQGIGKIYHGANPTGQDADHSWNEGWLSASTGNTWYEPAKAALEDAGGNNVSATDAGEVDRMGDPITDAAYNDGNAAEMGVGRIAAYAAAGDPFFLAVGFQKPHLPFNCPKAYWDLYDPSMIDLSGYDGSQNLPMGTNDFTAPYSGEPAAYDDIEGIPTPAQARHLIHAYLACVTYIDAQIGKLLDALDDPDGDPMTDDSIADNTIIVAWGDHGWHLGDHNGFWAKHSNYEQATRVPLIVSAPGMGALGSAGRKCSAPVELVDLFPTLNVLCGLPDPVQPGGFALQGTSFLPLLEDPDQPWKRAAFSQYQRNINGTGVGDSGPGMGYSIRTDRYRYTEWWRTSSTDDTTDLDEIIGSEPEHRELYDYLADPGETVNLAEEPAFESIVAELAALLNDSSDTGRAGDGWQRPEVNAPVTFPDTYESWRERHLQPGTSSSSLDPLEDPDRDGWGNRLEYKFGTHPLEVDAPGLAVATGGGLHLAFPDVVVRTDVDLQAEASGGLDIWSAGGVSVVASSERIGRATVMTATTPDVDRARFLRLRASQP